MKAVLVISAGVIFCDVRCINKLCLGESNTEDNLITLNIANDSFLKRDTLRVF